MKPNIIFILLDGARWDRLKISQEFTELQNYGTMIDNVTATVPYTFSAMNVIFTGLYPQVGKCAFAIELAGIVIEIDKELYPFSQLTAIGPLNVFKEALTKWS